MPEKDRGPNINGKITAEEVRLVDADGQMVGVVSLEKAFGMAEEAGLDLVEVSPNAEPPVRFSITANINTSNRKKLMKHGRSKRLSM